MELTFYVLEMQNWNIPLDRARGIDDKNEVICLVFSIFLYLYPPYLTNGNLRAYIPYHFLKKLKNMF